MGARATQLGRGDRRNNTSRRKQKYKVTLYNQVSNNITEIIVTVYNEFQAVTSAFDKANKGGMIASSLDVRGVEIINENDSL